MAETERRDGLALTGKPEKGMPASSPHEVTQLLIAWTNGDEDAFNRLIPLVEAELQYLARVRLKKERRNHTLEPAALINEAYLKMFGEKAVEWKNRAHFFAIASERMRQILVDYGRRRKSNKRGGSAIHVSMTAAEQEAVEPALEILAVNEALETLARVDPLQYQIVVMRYFGGLTADETAGVLKLATHKVEREWRMARAWLYGRLKGKEENEDDA